MTSARGSYAKYWCFTENVEPDQLRHALIDEGLPDGITYVCGQIEKGQKLHYQGYLELEARQRISWLKRNFSPTAHFEIRRGTQEEAIEYTRKVDETTVPMTWNEWGEPTDEKKGKRNDLLDVKAMLDDGCPEEEIANQHFGSWVRYNKAFQQYRMLISKKRNPDDPIDVVVLFGATGLGKSRMAHSAFGAYYKKPVGSVWFDGYNGEETVLFDEFGGHWMPYGTLLSITDRYPCTVPVKGGHVQFSAKRLIFTTNCHPSLWYKSCYAEALMRRISKIIYFEDGQDPLESVYPFEEVPVRDFAPRPEPTNRNSNYSWN